MSSKIRRAEIYKAIKQEILHIQTIRHLCTAPGLEKNMYIQTTTKIGFREIWPFLETNILVLQIKFDDLIETLKHETSNRLLTKVICVNEK